MSDNMSLTSSTDSDNDGPSALTNEVDTQKEQLLSSGSAALLNGSSRDAVEKFKSALDMISGAPLKKISAVELIIRYALCVAWIKCKEYRDIVRAIESLNQLIEGGHAGKLPALYLALARAYFSLNRFKAALDPIEKALKSIQRLSNIKQYFWPGIQQAIEETSKDSLKKSLLALQKDCGAYRPPDATCRYEKCLNVNQDNILPSENIYFSDPDFLPFISLNCEAKCKIAYHDSCWKHLKHERSDLDKYKDFLGQSCPTENCVTSDNDGNIARSVIVEVKLFGREGFDKPLKSWLLSENLRKHSSANIKKISKSETAVDKNSHLREKSVSESNGHSDKIILKSEDSRSEVALLEDRWRAEEKLKNLEERNPQSLDSEMQRNSSGQTYCSPTVSEISSSLPVASCPVRPLQPYVKPPHDAHDISRFENFAPSYCVPRFSTSYHGCQTSAFVGPPVVQHQVHTVQAVSTMPMVRNSLVPIQPMAFQYHNFYGSPAYSPLVQGQTQQNAIPPWQSSGYYQQPAQTWTPHPPQFHKLHPQPFVPRQVIPQFIPTLPLPVMASNQAQLSVATSQPSLFKPSGMGRNLIHSDASRQFFSGNPFVEVVVQKTSVVSAGSTLLIPIGPTGGPVQIIPVGGSGSCHKNNPKLHDVVPHNFEAKASEAVESSEIKIAHPEAVESSQIKFPHPKKVDKESPMKEVIMELKQVVKTISGEENVSVKIVGEHSAAEPQNSSSVTKSFLPSLDKSTRELPYQIEKGCSFEGPCSVVSEGLSFSGRNRSTAVVEESLEKHCNVIKNLNSQDLSSCSHMPTYSHPSVDTCHIFTHSPSELRVSPLTESSDLQAKVKHPRPKEKKSSPDTQASLMSPAKRTLPKLEQESSAEEKLSSRVQRLKRARKINFGYSNNNYVNPELPYFGQSDQTDSKFVEPGIINKVDETSAEFVFSFYQSIFDNNGPHKIEDLEDRWEEDHKQLQLPQSLYENNKSISKFLLLSPRFAAIDNIIGTSELLPDMFSKAEVELTESVSFLLFSKVQKPRCKEDRITPDFIFEPKSDQIKLASFSDRTRFSSTSSNPSSPDMDDGDIDTSVTEDLDGPHKFDTALLDHMDDNENPIDSLLCTTPSLESTEPVVKSRLRATSEPFIPGLNNNSPKDDVYMSEDDEDLDGSLVEIENDNNSWKKDNTFAEYSEHLHPSAVVLNEIPVVPPTRWSDGDDCSVMNATNLRNTLSRHAEDVEDCNIPYLSARDTIQEDLIAENVSLKKAVSDINAELESERDEKRTLITALSEASTENSNLLSEIESLKVQLELESDHSKALEKAKETLEQKLKCKESKYKELENKVTVAEASAKEHLENLESQVAKHKSQTDKIQRDHAKEINYLSKKLTDEKQTMEKKINDVEKEVKVQEQLNLKLWKELCDLKVRTFFQTCNSRINVLNQLKDKMSDTVSPNKAEISSSIKELESLMKIGVNKEKEINEVHKKEQERLDKGVHIQSPPVMNLPDILSVPYPLEAAVSLLERTNQEEPLALRNPYPQPHQLFNNTLSANGTPMPSHSPMSPHPPMPSHTHDAVRDLEAFSFRQRPPNETYQLWSHSFSSQGLPSLMHITGQQPLPSRSIYSPSMLSSGMSPLMPSNASLPGAAASTTAAVNGAAANPYPNILGSKPLSYTFQKANSSTTQASMVTKPTASAPLVSAGAVPKLPSRPTQTSPAALTPIMPTKGTLRKGKTNFEKLMTGLQKVFPTRSEMELNQALKMAREKNNNTLSSLSHSEIVARVGDALDKHFKKQPFMGLEKFGQAAWGAANKSTAVEWDGGVQDACVICHDPMSIGVVETLQCKHAFHKECIREWFQRDRVCPNCRKPSTMQDEFPPLG